jgi:hypothetical protein
MTGLRQQSRGDHLIQQPSSPFALDNRGGDAYKDGDIDFDDNLPITTVPVEVGGTIRTKEEGTKNDAYS